MKIHSLTVERREIILFDRVNCSRKLAAGRLLKAKE